jgi:hypothetical protein
MQWRCCRAVWRCGASGAAQRPRPSRCVRALRREGRCSCSEPHARRTALQRGSAAEQCHCCCCPCCNRPAAADAGAAKHGCGGAHASSRRLPLHCGRCVVERPSRQHSAASFCRSVRFAAQQCALGRGAVAEVVVPLLRTARHTHRGTLSHLCDALHPTRRGRRHSPAAAAAAGAAGKAAGGRRRFPGCVSVQRVGAEGTGRCARTIVDRPCTQRLLQAHRAHCCTDVIRCPGAADSARGRGGQQQRQQCRRRW